MLGKLFGSKARVKILKLFLSHPDEKYYIRQIARNLKLQLNSVRRELENLEQFGLLISNPGKDSGGEEAVTRENFIMDVKPKKKIGAKKTLSPKLEKKYYQANKNFILYEEIKALVVKAQILYEKDFVKKLQRAGRPKLLVLAGYFMNEPERQVDILVVGRFNKAKLARLIRELENELGREINYTLLPGHEFRYRRDITDIFLYNILEGKKLVVIDELGLS